MFLQTINGLIQVNSCTSSPSARGPGDNL